MTFKLRPDAYYYLFIQRQLGQCSTGYGNDTNDSSDEWELYFYLISMRGIRLIGWEASAMSRV